MILDNSVLTLDIKVQDKMRNLLAQRDKSLLPIVGVMLGDSDIDYNIPNMNNAAVLNSPFNVEKIKYPLIYSGSVNGGLQGNITCFARQIFGPDTIETNPNYIGPGPGYDGDIEVSSTYNYPPTTTYSTGNTVPLLNNGININSLPFIDPNTTPSGGTNMSGLSYQQSFILFFQTLLLNYYDPNTNLQNRLNEEIDIQVTFDGSSTIPTGYEIIIDNTTTPVVVNGYTINVYHNSILITQASGFTFQPSTYLGLITATGKISNITKTINFKISTT